MKIFIVGLPKSGKTTVCQAISGKYDYFYIGSSWLQHSFRPQNSMESLEQYTEEYQKYCVSRLKDNPNLYIDNFNSIVNICQDKNFVIDGISSPRDFIHLFDYNKDMVVVLNRTDNESYFKDFENVSISVIKDYCYWLSSSGLLPKNRWLEYNFKIPGSPGEMAIKTLGEKNTVFIARSMGNVIAHLLDRLKFD